MNTHMERTSGASRLIILGTIIMILFIFLAICAGMSRIKKHKLYYVLAFVAFAAAGVAMLVTGASQPMEKIIRACADGPVSLEQVAVRYDIIGVDGKELTLREK